MRAGLEGGEQLLRLGLRLHLGQRRGCGGGGETIEEKRALLFGAERLDDVRDVARVSRLQLAGERRGVAGLDERRDEVDEIGIVLPSCRCEKYVDHASHAQSARARRMFVGHPSSNPTA